MFFLRFLKFLPVLLAASIPAFSAEPAGPAATPTPALETSPFDVDAVRNELSPTQRIHLNYFERVTIDAYRKIGSHNPKWDADAELALKLYALSRADSHAIWGRPAMPVLLGALRRLVAVGCDDPMVRHVIYKTDELCLKVNLPFEQKPTYYRSVIASFKDHPYPVSRQCFMRLAGAGALKYSDIPPEKSYPEANDILVAAIKELPEVMKEDIPEDELCNMVSRLFDELSQSNEEKRKLFEEIYPSLEAAAGENSVYPLIIKGRFYCKMAFSSKPPAGVAETAHRAFEAAWDRNQTDANICAGLMDFSQSDSERKEWFEECKKLDSHFAYNCLLNYALPEWGGSLDKLLAVGRQAYKEGDWEHGTPLTLIGAHDLYVKRCTYDYGAAYYSQPAVWEEIKMVYEEYLKRYPNDNENRSAYLRHAWLCKRWPEARALLDQLGDMAVPAAFGLHSEFYRALSQIRAHTKTPAP